MGHLFADTEVQGRSGRFTANLGADWAVWTVNGGYLAAVALRAAAESATLRRPGSIAYQFLASPRPGPVELQVETLRASRSTEVLSVRTAQAGDPVGHATVTMVADGLVGLAHDGPPMPPVPRAEQLRSSRDLLSEQQWSARPPIWSTFEERPIDWPDDWTAPSARPPRLLTWLRFEGGTHDDPVVDAGRLLVALDLFPPSAAFRAYDDAGRTHLPVSLDLQAVLHRPASRSPWILVDAEAPVAAGGLVGGRAAVWSATGELLGSSTQQMLCRSVKSRT